MMLGSVDTISGANNQKKLESAVTRQLLIDSFSFKLNHLLEDGNDPYTLSGKFGHADVPTSNKRLYPRKIYEREIQKLQKKISEGKVYGELDHPDDGKTKLQRTAVLLKKLTINENGEVIGQIKILETSMGKELRAIVDGGGAIGISSRGYGSVRLNEDGYNVVQEDFNLMTFDPVADPAESSAYLEQDKPAAAVKEDEAELSGKKQDSASPAKNEPALGDENLDAKENTTDTVADAPNGNVSANEAEDLKDADEKKEAEKDVEAAKEDGKKDDDKAEEKKDEAKATDVKEDVEVESVKTESAVDIDSVIEAALENQRKNFEAQLLVTMKETKDKLRENVRTELFSEMMSDPSVAGSKDALDKVKSILRPYVLPEDISTTLDAKDKEISSLSENIKELETKYSSSLDQLKKMTEAAKEMGYSLYLERNLKGLEESEYKSLVESLGDYKKIETLSELKTRVSSSVKKSATLIEEKENRILALEESLNDSAFQAETLKEELENKMVECRNYAARTYLERKTSGNPYQIEIRKRFETIEEKTKQTADDLIDSYRNRRISESSDFAKVRNRLRKTGGFHVPEDLVENEVISTRPGIIEEKLDLGGNESLSLSDIKRLAGV